MHRASRTRQLVEALDAGILETTLADEEALRLQPAQHRVEGAFLDGQARFGEQGPEVCTSVFAMSQRAQGRQHQRPAAQLLHQA